MTALQIDLNEVLPDGTYVLLRSEQPAGGCEVGDKFDARDYDGFTHTAVVTEVRPNGACLLHVDAGSPVSQSGRVWAGASR